MNDKFLLHMQSLHNDAGLIVTHRRAVSSFICAHFGTSMNPTLCELDVLEIAPYGSRPVRVGDVILFVPPNWDRPAVHRVVSLTPDSIRTRGDNNNRIDTWVLRPEQVIGQVVRAARGMRERPIYGGMIGRLWAVGVSVFKVLLKVPSFFYHFLARSGILRYVLPLYKRMRIITINRPGGEELQLVLGKWLVGRCKPGMNYWWIRRPFRLFIDADSLPQ